MASSRRPEMNDRSLSACHEQYLYMNTTVHKPEKLQSPANFSRGLVRKEGKQIVVIELLCAIYM